MGGRDWKEWVVLSFCYRKTALRNSVGYLDMVLSVTIAWHYSLSHSGRQGRREGQDSGDFGLEMEKLNQACTGWPSRGCLYKDLALLVGFGTTILPQKSFLTYGCCLASAVESTAYLYRKWSLLFAGSVFNPQRFCVCKECEVQIFNLMVINFEQCTQAFGAFWSALKSRFQLVS